MFPQIFGKYVLEREIAAGGMARVYLATLRGAVGFEKRLVVKQIRPELASDDAFVRRFVEEAKTSVELSHPNIVPVYELGVEHGIYYIAMELCDGLTLAEVMAETGALDPEEGAYVGVEVCRALDYAHRRAGIVHRDVTPRNVLLDEEGAVRLIDFGIAAPATPVPGAKREVFGSPGHMPLEQLRGERLTAATDVFAVGALLIEAWTTKPPFRRANAVESEKALATSPEPLDAAVPRLAPLSALIAASVASKPADRPASAELLARPLREFLKSADLGDIARRLGERVRKTRRRSQHSSPWLAGDGVSAAVGTPRTPVAQALAGTPKSLAAGTPPGSLGAMPSVTRTFAAREEWTRKLPSVPPSGPVPTADPADAGSQPMAAASERVNSSLELASSPAVSVRSSTAPRSRQDDDASPTTAPRPLPDPSRAASGWRLVAVLLAGVVIAGLITVRFSGSAATEPSKPPAVDTGTPAAPPPRTTASAVTTVAVQEPAPPASVVEPPPRETAKPVHPKRAEVPATSASTSAPRETCTLTLSTNLEGTSASVDGRGATLNAPVALPCGGHSLRFHNQTLGEKLGPESIMLRAGEGRSVLADWTSAKPRIVIVR
jgi:eukaryotic-like serine/threonine-protein kinase